ncbi:MAG: hypothetical protein ABGX91_09075 [Thermoleophilia bacterium]
MTTAEVTVLVGPDILPPGCEHVRPDGVLSRVRRTCCEHRADAYCVGRAVQGPGLVYWCTEGRHHLTSDKR